MSLSRLRQFVALALVLWHCTASAQEPRTLMLEESIALAQQTNLSIQSVQENIEIAKAQVGTVRAPMLPNVSLTGNYTYFKDIAKSVIEASGGFGPPLPDLATRPDASGENGSSDVIELEFGAHHNFRGTLTLQQPIFAWGRYYYNYQSAVLSLEATQKELEAATNQLVLDVSEAFYRILVAQEFVKVAQQTVKGVEKQLELARSLFEAGASTKFDVLRAEVQLANVKSQLIRSQNQVRTAKDAFKNLLNINLTEDIEVSGSLEIPIAEFNIESLIQMAMDTRPERQQFELSERANQKRVDVAKTGNRPDLSFFVNYQVDDSERLSEMNRVWNLGLQINFPIFDGLATRTAVKQARSALKQTQLGKDQLTNAIEFEVRKAYRDLIETIALIDVQKETVEQAQESVRLANVRYENGMITSVELTDAQLALSQAQANRLQSLHDYVVGLARLEKAVGQKLR